MIKDHSRHRMTESRLLIRNRAIQKFQVIAGIQTYIDYLHDNLLFFAPEGRINFAQGDVAGLTQVVNNYAAMLKIPQIKPTPTLVYPFSINYLIVAGGGAAGSSFVGGNGAGGGGAGGVVSGSWLVTAAGVSFSMVVGAGGVAQPPSAWGYNGGNSSISSGSSVTAIGGGGGAGEAAPYLSGRNGGSGGGAGTNGLISGSVGLGTSRQGFNGGLPDIGMDAGGGGGGAGGLGGVPYTDVDGNQLGGNGGSPIPSSITGSSQYYAGGGGGCGVDAGGLDGNGLGSGIFGGGGNSHSQGNVGGDGKSGGIILSIPTASYSGIATNSPLISTSGANTIITYSENGSYTS
jgi:hypothetical protein